MGENGERLPLTSHMHLWAIQHPLIIVTLRKALLGLFPFYFPFTLCPWSSANARQRHFSHRPGMARPHSHRRHWMNRHDAMNTKTRLNWNSYQKTITELVNEPMEVRLVTLLGTCSILVIYWRCPTIETKPESCNVGNIAARGVFVPHALGVSTSEKLQVLVPWTGFLKYVHRGVENEKENRWKDRHILVRPFACIFSRSC